MHRQFWTTAQLRVAGVTKREAAERIRSGQLIRIRTGYFCTPDAPDQLVRAIRVGGLATATTAALQRGVWAVPDDLLHVALPPHAARLRDPDAAGLAFRRREDVCLHWNTQISSTPMGGMTAPAAMLEHAFRCRPPEHALAMLDSALHLRFIRPAELDGLAQRVPAGQAALIAHADGRAESGIESIARYRLRLAGLRVEVQVPIDGVGRVDLLVEGWLIVELDGRAFHDDATAFARDRRRSALATLSRYRTERFDYRQVLFEWPTVEAAIFAALGR